MLTVGRFCSYVLQWSLPLSAVSLFRYQAFLNAMRSALCAMRRQGIPLGTPFGLQISSHLFMGAFLFGRYWWDVFAGCLDQVEGVGLDDFEEHR